MGFPLAVEQVRACGAAAVLHFGAVRTGVWPGGVLFPFVGLKTAEMIEKEKEHVKSCCTVLYAHRQRM